MTSENAAERALPDLMPAGPAHDRWFSDMGRSAYYGALGTDIPAKKFGGKWFVLTRPLLRILEGERDAA